MTQDKTVGVAGCCGPVNWRASAFAESRAADGLKDGGAQGAAARRNRGPTVEVMEETTTKPQRNHNARCSPTSNSSPSADRCRRHVTTMPQRQHRRFGQDPEQQRVPLESSPLLLHGLHLPFPLPLLIFIHLGSIFMLFLTQFLVNYPQG